MKDRSVARIPVNEIATMDLGTMRPSEEKVSTEIDKLPRLEIPKSDQLYVKTATDFKVVLTFIRGLKIEVVLFFYMFSYIIRSVTSITMIMEKVCYVHLKYSSHVCSNLDLKDYADEKRNVETMTNNYHLFHTLVALVPSVVLSSFIGPWSDTYGRKAPIIAGLIGIIIDGTLAIFCAYKIDSRVEWYVAVAIFTGFSGGFISVFTIVYSYVSDTSVGNTRTFKYALLEMSMGLGLPLGQLAGGWIYRYTGYVAVFITSVSGHVLALIWVIFVIEETRGMDNKDIWQVKVRNFFSFERFKESVRATTKRRPNKGRMQIWLLILCMSLVFLAMAGGSGISYLYTYHHYNWTNTKYSTVSSIFAVMGLILMLIAVPVCTRILKMGDPMLGIIGSISNVAKHLCIAMSSKEGGYYLANLLGFFVGLSTLAGRARISKIVSRDDLGKVFAFLSTVETALPIAATAVISQVFNKTVGMYPDPSYLSLSFVLVISLAVFVWLAFLPRVDYEKVAEDSQEEELKEEPPIKITEI